ncbi:hypothetical protein GCM10027601_26990 [Nocardioides ungokensis]
MLGVSTPTTRKAQPMSRPVTVRRALAAAALPLALTSLSACGSNDDAKAQDPSSGSSSSSSSSSADTPSAGDTVAPADFVDRFESGFTKTTTAHETLKMSMGTTGTLTGEGDVDYSSDSPAMQMTMKTDMTGATGSIEMRLVDGVMYMTIPGMAGGKFVKFDLNDPNSPFGSLATQLDPQEAFKSFEAGIKSVTYVGAEDGLDHYQVTVDTKKMLAKMGQTGSAASAAGMPATLTYDAWLDSEDRVNKMEIDLGKTGTMDMTLSDFGQDVSVEAPPSSQVTQMPGMGSPTPMS